MGTEERPFRVNPLRATGVTTRRVRRASGYHHHWAPEGLLPLLPQRRAGWERRPIVLNSPHPDSRPTRPSRGEEENSWRECQEDAPPRAGFRTTRLTLEAQLIACLAI